MTEADATDTRSNPRSRRAVLLRFPFWGLYLALLALFVARSGFEVGGTVFFALFDDAMISMRYAHHLAEGRGLAWNADAPPVEGVTNLLWTLWMAVPHLLGIPVAKTSLFVMATGAGLMVAVVVLTGRVARLVFPDSPVVPCAAQAVAGMSYGLVFWTLRGMEVGLLAALFLASAVCVLDRRAGATARQLALGAITVAALATRPDTLPVVGIAWLCFAWSDGWRRAVPGFAIVAATVAGMTMFRVQYFGDALPNTWYLKMTGSTLWERVARGAYWLGFSVCVSLWPLLVPAALGLWNGESRRSLCGPGSFLAVVPLVLVAYSVYVGGDAWEDFRFANRYVAPAIPFLAILAAGAIEAFFRSATATSIVRAAGTLLGIVAIMRGVALLMTILGEGWKLGEGADTLPYTVSALVSIAVGAAVIGLTPLLVARSPGGSSKWRRLLDELPAALHRRPAAWALLVFLLLWAPCESSLWMRWLAAGYEQRLETVHQTRLAVLIEAASPADASIAVSWAGTIPYLTDRPAIDLLGKSDPVIARGARARDRFAPGHDKWDYDYSIGRLQPDIVVDLDSSTREEHRRIRAYGYRLLPSGLLVRDASRNIDRDLLGTFWMEDAAFDAAMESLREK